MKKLIFVLSAILFSNMLFSLPKTNYGYKGFVLNMTKNEARKIIKKDFKNFIVQNVTVEKDNNIIGIGYKNEIQNKRHILLYFNEKNILYKIIVGTGYEDENTFRNISDNMKRKYENLGRREINKPELLAVGFYDGDTYVIMCYLYPQSEDLNISIQYSNLILEKKYENYLNNIKEEY